MRKISIIIPVYNEEENLNPLYSEISSVLNNIDFELIFVDDGSIDRSWEVIKEITLKDERVKGIRFGKNYGQTQAIRAGIEHSTSSIIIIMDGDLQNDPADIPKLLDEINRGYDVVSGWRRRRKDKYFTRILPSQIANWFISKITGVKLNDYGCTLKAYRKEIIEKVDLYGEMHRFIPALCAEMGAKIKEIEVNHRPRMKGNSKYGLERIFKVIFDLLTVKFMGDFSTKPIYFFGSISIVLLFISTIFFLITIYNKWYNHIFVKDQPLFLVAIFLSLIAVQVALIGLVAEMIKRIYYFNKKPYYVKERIYDKEEKF